MSVAQKATGALGMALMLCYPVVVYFGLGSLSPRWLGLGLLAVLLLRHGASAVRFLQGTDPAERALMFSVVALAIAIVVADSELLLRLYPALLSGGMLLLFARTLRHPPSMIERFARLREPELSPNGVRYTYRVTQVWCLFLASNAAIALSTAFLSREVWILWNGLISYLLMGCLFAGEWLLRQRLLQRMEHAG